MPEVVLASFNAHAGVRPRSLPELRLLTPSRRTTMPDAFDLAGAIVGLDADIVVVPEAFRPDDGASAVDEAAAKLGYEVNEVSFGRAVLGPWPHLSNNGSGTGEVGLAVLSRFPVRRCTEVPVRRVPFDPALSRQALHLEVDVDGVPLDVVGVHLTSRLPHGPAMQLRHLRPQLPHAGQRAVVAGDLNFWWPGIAPLMEGWRRAVQGRTWPAHRPHSQIDHILVRPGVEVLAGEVLDNVGSDHRPVRTRLYLPD